MSLGDSYTIGQGLPEASRWPVLLGQRWHISPEIIAATGWTTSDLIRALKAAKPNPSYALVTLMIGVNNQYQGRPLLEYRREFDDLLKLSLERSELGAKCVVVLSVPDWGQTPFAEGQSKEAIASEIDAYNQINKEITQEFGAAYVDITPLSRDLAAHPEWLATDGLHYSQLMHQQWADRVVSRLQNTDCLKVFL